MRADKYRESQPGWEKEIVELDEPTAGRLMPLQVTGWHRDLMEADMQFRKQMAILERLRRQMADAELMASKLRREITRLLDARVKQEVGQ